MSRAATGWAFVAIQAILLAALVLMPGAEHWPTPDWLDALSTAMVAGGLVVVAVAALGLGPALTATPVPTKRGQLATGGLFRWVRHPIYSGVLLIVVALGAGSGNLAKFAIAAATIGFFHVKARWEEGQLARRYPDYSAYAALTPRFVPRLRPSFRRR